MIESQGRRKPILAGEIFAEQARDPAFIRRMEELEKRQQAALTEYMRNAAPVHEELAAAGFRVASIQALYQAGLNYKAAIPILLKWLPLIDDERVKESIVRALSVKWGKPVAARPLIAEFRIARYDNGAGPKWTIGDALARVADDSVFDEIVELLREKQHGKPREMLALALCNMKDPRAVDVLIEMLDDEEVAGHAVNALRKLAPKRARPHLERFLTHPKTWVRNEAKRAVAKIDKAG